MPNFSICQLFSPPQLLVCNKMVLTSHTGTGVGGGVGGAAVGGGAVGGGVGPVVDKPQKSVM